MTKVVAVIGTGRRSGKTTTVEALLKELVSKNYRVGTIKQIHEEDFSLDKPHKDTWRHAEAGAKVVISAAPHEVAAIKRLKSEDRFTSAMRLLRSEDLDLVIVEGNPPVDVIKILATRDPASARRIIEKVDGVVFISTLTPDFDASAVNVPVFHPIKDSAKMVEILESLLATTKEF
jgi:molybdopterin-guanine dinucleotide biosynthesis protein MobB